MSDIELAMSHYSAARVTALEVRGGDSSRWHEAGIAAVWTLARGCAYEDAARRVREGHMCPGCGHRDEAANSGVAGEPEATTKEASEIAVAASTTPTHAPTPESAGAANVAGGVTVPDEAVEAYYRGEADHTEDRPDCCARAGLAAAAPLIVEHYLRHRIRSAEVDQTPEEVWERVREMARHAALRTAAVDALRSTAAVLLDDERLEPTGHDDRCSYGPPGECDCFRGGHYRWLIARADELERKGDRG